MSHRPNRTALTGHGRRRGVAMVYFALALTVIMGMVGFVLDMGHIYTVRAQLQKAADAAALAGVPYYTDPSTARTYAIQYARLNGFDTNDTANGVQVVSIVNPTGVNPNWHRVIIRRNVDLYFMPILGLRKVQVGAKATAQFTSDVSLNVKSGDQYGKSPGSVTYSDFGPYAQYSNGDPYSPLYFDDGSPNTYYKPGGYNFKISVPASYTNALMDVQIFDPDTYNAGGNPQVLKGVRIDEIRDPTTPVKSKPGYTTNITTTRYSLYYDNPVTGASTLIAQASYGADATTDMKWVTPSGFEFNPNDALYGGSGVAKNFRLNVKSTDGSSENGYDLRAGAPGTADADYATNGTSINPVGAIPINFTEDNTLVNLSLANIPAPPAGFTGTPQVTINKFDTDIHSQSVNYTVDPAPSNQPSGGYAGVLAGNGQWVADTITLPKDYKTGLWTSNYTAGWQDTSLWSVSTNYSVNSTGSINLVE